MNVLIGKDKALLKDPQDLLGEGGEAKVFSCIYDGKPAAAKIYKPGILASKLGKLQALIQMARQFPNQVMVPKAFVFDLNLREIGTVTELAEGEDLVQLCQVDFKENNRLDNNFTNDYFRRVHATLSDLHRVGVIVGDLNYNNLKFKPSQADYLAMLDVDSMAIPGYKASAMHPLFFDPKFKELLEQYKIGASKLGYKLQLSRYPDFNQDSDWYSYHVMLFWALMTINPWQGQMPGAFNEFLRMELRKTILSPGVRIPKMVVQPDMLDDDLRHHFIQVFEKDKRAPFPLGLLKRWQTCKGCGLSFCKKFCPGCQTGVTATVAMVQHQTCTMKVLTNLVGKQLLAHSFQDKLRYVYAENCDIRNQDGEGLISLTPSPDTRFAIGLNKVYIGQGTQIYEVWPGVTTSQIVVRTTTKLGRLPVFGANSLGLYRIMGNKLVDPMDKPIGTVTPDKCWFTVGNHLGFGFNKIGSGYYYFCFRVGYAGFLALDLPNPKGRMIDWSVHFGQDCLLYTMASELGGQRYHEMFLIRNDGTLLAKMEENPTNRIVGSILGKYVWNQKMILSSTDDGIMTFGPEPGNKPTSFAEGKLFHDTAKFVKAGNEIYLSSDGKIVYVMGHKEVMTLTV